MDQFVTFWRLYNDQLDKEPGIIRVYSYTDTSSIMPTKFPVRQLIKMEITITI